MAYAVERDEAMHDAVVRIFDEQIVRVRAHLTDAKAPLEERIHDARKRFKETRALVRMVREPLGALYAVENAWFRDAGRDLASVRDAQAVIEAVKKLASAKRITMTTVLNANRALEARRDAMNTDELQARIGNVVAQLDATLTRVASWPLLGRSVAAVTDGLLRTYRGGRRAMRAAMRAHSPHALHEWRKRVKEHWYHMQLLRMLAPRAMKSRIALLEQLSRTLGDHHDLFTLRRIIAASPRDFGTRRAVVRFLDAIDARQQELETQAAELGERIYAEPPKAWLARMQNDWSAQ